MTSRRLLPLVLLMLALFALAGCHHPNVADQVGGATPQAAVQGSIDQLKAGNLGGLWKHALPPADYAMLRTDWPQQTGTPWLDATWRVKIDAALRELSGPDAANHVYARLQPWLDHEQSEYGDQVPVLLAMEGAVLKKRLTATMNTTQKAQVDGLIDALVPWAQRAPWSDAAHTRQALTIAAATAGKLGITSLAQLHTLTFDDAMRRYSFGWQGAKQLLAVYGLSVDNTLASARLGTVSERGDHAVVQIDYSLLGKSLSLQTTVVRQDGRWYSQSLIDAVHAAHARLQPPATASTVEAGTWR